MDDNGKRDGLREVVCEIGWACARVDLQCKLPDGEEVALRGAAVHGCGGVIRLAARLEGWLRMALEDGTPVRVYLLLTMKTDTVVDVQVVAVLRAPWTAPADRPMLQADGDKG